MASPRNRPLPRFEDLRDQTLRLIALKATYLLCLAYKAVGNDKQDSNGPAEEGCKLNELLT